MTYDFEVSTRLAASPQKVYEAWLSSDGHGAMTGGEAHVSGEVGDDFDAWDGYIHGTNLELDPFSRIVQSWRSSQFTDEHEDSRIEVLLEGDGEGTLITIRHSNVPDDQRGYEEGGWQRSYLTPMKNHFEAN